MPYATTKPVAPRPLLSVVMLCKIVGLFGSGGWDRTNDQLINSQLLYR